MNPYLSLLTGDLWLMEVSALERLVQQLTDPIALSTIAKITIDGDEEGDEAGYEVRDGVAHIAVSGTLMKSVPMIYKYFGINCTGYDDVSQAIDDASDDENVDAIMLDIDSPGGSASGIHAMADKIFNCKKTCMAHVDSLCASGAYWMASQCDQITAGRGAQIGSIGAYTARFDTSRAAENDGIKVHLISSGPHKGGGYPGTAISQEQLDEVQKGINALAAEFIADISRGRGTSAEDIQPSADGRVFSASDAKAKSLIDSITSDPIGEYIMARDAAAQKEYDKQGRALFVAHSKHSALIDAALEKGTEIADIRKEIETAEQVALVASEKATLITSVRELTAKLEAETSAHTATKTKLATVQADYDAIAKLSTGAAPASKVKADATVATTKTQAEVDAMPNAEKASFYTAFAKGTVQIV